MNKYKVINELKIFQEKPEINDDKIVGTLKRGFIFDAVEIEGENYRGSKTWLKDNNNFYYWGGGVEKVGETDDQIEENDFIDREEIDYAWDYSKIPAIPNHIRSNEGEDSIIAIFDSGCSQHPALNGKVMRFYDAVNEHEPDHPEDFSEGYHGTFVAGLIAGRDQTFHGVAPGSKLIVVRVTEKRADGLDKVSTWHVIEGLRWLKEECEEVPDIINISLQFWRSPDQQKELEKLFGYFKNNGILTVSGANNDSSLFGDRLYYPATEPDVISVGALKHSSLERNLNKNLHPEIDYIVPNIAFHSLSEENTYCAKNGCSFSAAIVSGALACFATEGRKTGQTNLRGLFQQKLQPFESGIFTDELNIYKL